MKRPRHTYPARFKNGGEEVDEPVGEFGAVVVVENVFHYRPFKPLVEGDNVFGRWVHGTEINQPLETTDPSIDTKHCIIRVERKKNGQLRWLLRDAPSNTGTFYMNDILRDQDRMPLSDGDIVTIGATTMIFRAPQDDSDFISLNQ